MRGSDEARDVSNADLKRMLDRTLTRFENWRVEVERKPNPAMVHSLRNIMSIIESVTSMSERRMEYSYKTLVRRMADLVNETAALNDAIVRSLDRDDSMDEDELRVVSGRLFSLINAAAELARMVQEHFGPPGLTGDTGLPLLPEGASPAAKPARARRPKKPSAD